MMQTLNNHIRWRKDREDILICDCKRLIDLKLPLKYESFMEKLDKGIEKDNLVEEEQKVFSDFEKMKLLSNLEIRQIKTKEFNDAIKILDNELGKKRVRSKNYLSKKFKESPEFFIGAFLDKKIIGVVGGFPREDYLLISELAIDSRFQKRGFGKKLVEKFEQIAKRKYNKINVGAEDKAINFYSTLSYKPFLLIQFKKEDYNEDFDNFDLIRKYNLKGYLTIEAKVKNIDVKYLEKLRKKYSKVYFQYIFSKTL